MRKRIAAKKRQVNSLYSGNYKISNNQIKKMLVFDIVSISILILPGIGAMKGGRDGIFAIILGSVLALFYSYIFLYFSRNMDCDYMEYAKHHTGRIFTFIIGILYLVKILFSTLFILALFMSVIKETILPETNSRIILFTLILMGVYCASKGIEVRARITELLYFIVLVPLCLLLFLGIFKIDLANLFPLMTSDIPTILSSGYWVLITYSAAELILFAAPLLSDEKNKHHKSRYITSAILTAAIINIVLFIVVIGLLGPIGASRGLWSSITIMQIIEMPGGFLQRQDALILMFWLMSIFTVVSTCFYYLGKITKDITGRGKLWHFLLLYAIAIFFMLSRPVNIEDLYSLFGRYLAYIGLPQSLIIPAIVTLMARRKAPAGASSEGGAK